MQPRDQLAAILNRESRQNGFWHGHPHPDSLPIYTKALGVSNDLQLSLRLQDTFVWIMPEAHGCWQDPNGRPMFDVTGGRVKKSHNQAGVFADCESVAKVDRFPWPDPKHLDFTASQTAIERARKENLGILSGMWSSFFHDVADFFGMDNYFVKMYTDPKIVHAVTEKVVEFYLAANEIYLSRFADSIDAIFFGNDFGSQLDLLLSPDLFHQFVMPSFVRFTQQAKRYDLKVVLHSCGAIGRVIPDLIEAGVDALHPIQARARGMDAKTLASLYRDQIAFIGGVDTQHLLPFGSPEQVREEVLRLRDLFGPNFIVSPSHEALLPNVPPQNLLAMAEAARQ